MTSQEANILTVAQLTHAIKHCLESTFPNIYLQGEVSNFKKQSSGHLYFSLKDAQAQISAVMFRSSAISLPILPKDGDKVVIKGELNVFPPSGKYQIVVRELKQMGMGELLVKLEELKQKIHQKGWFRKEHKKPLPKFPKTIGVITSPTGAAIQDILNILTRRFKGFHLILNPVKVQGVGAADEIAQAINQFNRLNNVDVIIVGRGGGSIEDLWAFNEEIVAESIFLSRIPIIAAVGHETDHCIAEYVADMRAPTPSAAAEMVMAEKAQQLHHIDQMQQRLTHTIRHHLRHNRQRLQGFLKHPIMTSSYPLVGAWMQRLDGLRAFADNQMMQILEKKKFLIETKEKHLHVLKPSQQILTLRRKLTDYCRQLDHVVHVQLRSRHHKFIEEIKTKQLLFYINKIIQNKKNKILALVQSLESINPKKLLKKGYSILFSEKDHSVITSVKGLEKKQTIYALVSDGKLKATITGWNDRE